MVGAVVVLALVCAFRAFRSLRLSVLAVFVWLWLGGCCLSGLFLFSSALFVALSDRTVGVLAFCQAADCLVGSGGGFSCRASFLPMLSF